jgi:uncharacterized protein (DUF1786 family)
MNKAQDIKVVASRMRMVLRQTEGMPMEAMFWENLKTLLNLILEVGVNSADIKTIAERLRRMTKAGDQALLHGVFWDDLNTLLNLILEEEKDE